MKNKDTHVEDQCTYRVTSTGHKKLIILKRNDEINAFKNRVFSIEIFENQGINSRSHKTQSIRLF